MPHLSFHGIIPARCLFRPSTLHIVSSFWTLLLGRSTALTASAEKPTTAKPLTRNQGNQEWSPAAMETEGSALARQKGR